MEAGHEAYHALLSVYKVKNIWSYTTISPYKFMACFLTTDKENFILIACKVHIFTVILSFHKTGPEWTSLELLMGEIRISAVNKNRVLNGLLTW
jgi:hypothetical protein